LGFIVALSPYLHANGQLIKPLANLCTLVAAACRPGEQVIGRTALIQHDCLFALWNYAYKSAEFVQVRVHAIFIARGMLSNVLIELHASVY
jgi:hypothetical protein